MFVGKNFGDEDQTVIHKLMLYGTAGNNTNMGDWEKVAKKAMEIKGLHDRKKSYTDDMCPAILTA
eukprot:758038-Hanusia_phi.AAC.2